MYPAEVTQKLLNKGALEFKICHEEEEPNQFFTGNLFSKMFFPVLIFWKSGSAVLDFRSFPDCTQGQFQPLWRAANLPVGCLGMYLSQDLCLTKESCCNLPFLLLGFTRHEYYSGCLAVLSEARERTQRQPSRERGRWCLHCEGNDRDRSCWAAW